MAASGASFVDNHAIGAHEPIDERLNAHTAEAHLAVADDDAGLDKITGDDLLLEPFIHALDVHPAFGNLTALDLHAVDRPNDRQSHLRNLGIVDRAVLAAEERAGPAVERPDETLLWLGTEPSIHIGGEQL